MQVTQVLSDSARALSELGALLTGAHKSLDHATAVSTPPLLISSAIEHADSCKFCI